MIIKKHPTKYGYGVHCLQKRNISILYNAGVGKWEIFLDATNPEKSTGDFYTLDDALLFCLNHFDYETLPPKITVDFLKKNQLTHFMNAPLGKFRMVVMYNEDNTFNIDHIYLGQHERTCFAVDESRIIETLKEEVNKYALQKIDLLLFYEAERTNGKIWLKIPIKFEI